MVLSLLLGGVVASFVEIFKLATKKIFLIKYQHLLLVATGGKYLHYIFL